MRSFAQNELLGELRRMRHPTFDGEVKQGEYVEAWLLGHKFIPFASVHIKHGRKGSHIPFER